MTSRKLTVAFGGAHQARITHVKQFTWPELCAFLTAQPHEAIDKAAHGWYCPAEFSPEYRDSDNLSSRHAITFDFDHPENGLGAKILKLWSSLAFVLYSTHSHTPEKPRFRVVLPLNRPVSYDEYQAIARKVAESIGIENVARESFVPAQMMYLPCIKPKGEFKFHVNEGKWLDADIVLAEYKDWTDHSQWPHRAEADGAHVIKGEQISPRDKPGIIGAFCRAFSAPEAIEKFELPYTPTATPNRYTYTLGSRPEGAIVYDDGQKFHSHHDTDPARGQTNAFDLVRLHKFGHLDAEANYASVAERPSYRAMADFARSEPAVQDGAVDADFNDLGPLVSEELIVADPPQHDRFRVIPAEEFSSGKPMEWIVRGVLPRAELCVIYGESGSGKSFLTLDLCAAITRGISWRGKKTAKGKVVSVVAEGAGGYRSRMRAYAQSQGCELHELPAVVPDAPNLLEAKDVAELTQAILTWGKPDVIVIDTLSATTPGANENSGEDMGSVIAHCKFIHRKTGALVVLIHHSGKDASRGARGWSGLRAAADAEIEVVRNGDFRSASLTKAKDGEDGEQMPFRLRTIGLPANADGEPESSCVIEHTEEEKELSGGRQRPTGAHQILALDTIKMMAAGGSVNVEDLIEGILVKTPKPTGGGRDMRRRNAERAVHALVAKKIVCMQGEDRVSMTTAIEDDSWLG